MPTFGILPAITADCIASLLLEIWEYVSSSRGPFMLPLPWQSELVAQVPCIIGFTSALNETVTPVQSGVVGVVGGGVL